jgi:uncharacterized protein (DUF39 family)
MINKEELLKAGQKVLCIKTMHGYHQEGGFWFEEFIEGKTYNVTGDSEISSCFKYPHEIVHSINSEDSPSLGVWNPDFKEHFKLIK